MSKAALPPETTREEIGRRLTALRTARALTPAELCRDLGFAANAYSQYESGTRRPNLDDMMRLALAYGVTLDFIYLGKIDGIAHDMARRIQPLMRSEPERLQPISDLTAARSLAGAAKRSSKKVHGA